MVDVSLQLVLSFYVTLDSCLAFFADMNSLNWASLMGRKAWADRGASSSVDGEGARPKRDRKDCPLSHVIRD